MPKEINESLTEVYMSVRMRFKRFEKLKVVNRATFLSCYAHSLLSLANSLMKSQVDEGNKWVSDHWIKSL